MFLPKVFLKCFPVVSIAEPIFSLPCFISTRLWKQMHFVHPDFPSDLLIPVTKVPCQHSGAQIFIAEIWLKCFSFWFVGHFHRRSHMFCYVNIFLFCLQGDVGLPGPPGPPPSTGILEFMGFPKGKQGEKVCKSSLQTLSPSTLFLSGAWEVDRARSCFHKHMDLMCLFICLFPLGRVSQVLKDSLGAKDCLASR